LFASGHWEFANIAGCRKVSDGSVSPSITFSRVNMEEPPRLKTLRSARHFRWEGVRIVGLTAIGRTTIYVLVLNHPDDLAIREELLLQGRFPP
jgi:hypothetical protein